MFNTTLSDRFVNEMEKKRLIPIVLSILPLAQLKQETGDILNNSWEKFLTTYKASKNLENHALKLMPVITRNTCFEYIRLQSAEKKHLFKLMTKSPDASEYNEAEISIDAKYLLNSLPLNYKFILEAEQSVAFDNQQEFIAKITPAYKQKFGVKKFNRNVFKALKARARKKIEKMLGSNAI